MTEDEKTYTLVALHAFCDLLQPVVVVSVDVAKAADLVTSLKSCRVSWATCSYGIDFGEGRLKGAEAIAESFAGLPRPGKMYGNTLLSQRTLSLGSVFIFRVAGEKTVPCREG